MQPAGSRASKDSSSPARSRPTREELERHVLPRLGERRLDEIEVDHLLTLISDLRKQGYSRATIAATLTPLSRLFARAVPPV
jgi:hypothetical protein